MKKILYAVLLLVMSVSVANATTYVEDFEAPFPSWESGWFGTNSNARNYYGIGGDRGNNPDGLWIADEADAMNATIRFTPSFGATLSTFDIDIAGWAPASLRVYDMAFNAILDTNILLTQGGLTDPGTYAHYSVTSLNGISGFSILSNGGSQVEGNTSIDNLVVTTAPVPEPSTFILLGAGLTGAAFLRRRKNKTTN